jgi:ribonuclease VapC
MVLDSSAVVAILLAEPDATQFASAIEAADIRLISSATWVELGLVLLARKGDPGITDLERFVQDAQVELVSVDEAQARLAVGAFRDFGRGRHPAALNFGDCFAYALSKATGKPLLFKGGDFRQTDIVPAL